MSVVAGVVRDGVVHMAADSFVGGCYDKAQSREPKLFRKGEMIVGFSGDVSALGALRYRLTMPEHGEGESDMAFITVKVADAVRAAIGASGTLKKENDVESASSWLLIGYRGALYRMGSDFSTAAYNRDYDAIGAGQDYALAVLFLGQEEGWEAEKILRSAIDAAVEHSPLVCAPYVFEQEK